jgi:hypothetical protein
MFRLNFRMVNYLSIQDSMDQLSLRGKNRLILSLENTSIADIFSFAFKSAPNQLFKALTIANQINLLKYLISSPKVH